METIELESRDRRNIYREDAGNVVALEATADEIIEVGDEDEFDAACHKAREAVIQQGNRFAYIVIRVCR